MKEHFSKLREWWFSLGAREKKAVVMLGLFLAVFGIYTWVWSPLYQSVIDLRSHIATNQKTLLWMQAADEEIKQKAGQAKDKTQTVTPVTLLGVLQKKINEAELEQYLTQLKQANNDSIELHFQKVEFDKVMHLFIETAKENPIYISQMSATSENTSGIANVDVTIRLES